MTERPKVREQTQTDHVEPSQPLTAVEAANGVHDPGKEPSKQVSAFSPLDLLRCLDDPLPSKRPVRVASLASLRGRS